LIFGAIFIWQTTNDVPWHLSTWLMSALSTDSAEIP
jgi:hypothetical protein